MSIKRGLMFVFRTMMVLCVVMIFPVVFQTHLLGEEKSDTFYLIPYFVGAMIILIIIALIFMGLQNIGRKKGKIRARLVNECELSAKAVLVATRQDMFSMKEFAELTEGLKKFAVIREDDNLYGIKGE